MPQNKQACRIGAPCQIEANGIDTENYTVPVVLADETHVTRYSWSEGYYYLSLKHDEKSVDLTRKDILSMFVNHSTYDLPIARFANVRIEDKKLKADAVFDPDDEQSLKIFNKLSKGFLTSFSVGIDILSKVLTEEKEGVKYYEATLWSPYEASVVGIPANPNATVGLSHDTLAAMPTASDDKIANSNQGNPMEFNRENFDALLKKSSDLATELAKSDQKAEQLAKEAAIAETERLSKVFDAVGITAFKIESVRKAIFTAGATVTDIEAAMFRHEKGQKEKMQHTIQTEGETLGKQTQHIDGDGTSGDEMSAKDRRQAAAMAKIKAKGAK